MTKHQEYYQKMIDNNKQIFSEFIDLHDKYTKDSASWQVKYNEVGEKIVAIIRDWEGKLCRESERGQFGKYSANLADKSGLLSAATSPKSISSE
ncbi:MAG: hypothetical protein UV73_C0002G0017 [Candidatus Gottesmanbacteria bacterium GW2011_GWA2_43_14]|uniref:Uncharacterized protein n=1 Tax=Candidatus Gottesmanbacteria bacterium GW2011_GWA2_43_14 TaxID=1618443 RepID=A0A0G1GHN6_9BACT|nr:MAG: hypothetical protein UV73_C0002G0017 [Candidatus Gottesmanbacteria bacterium GW2011_GWA2_43_14]